MAAAPARSTPAAGAAGHPTFARAGPTWLTGPSSPGGPVAVAATSTPTPKRFLGRVATAAPEVAPRARPVRTATAERPAAAVAPRAPAARPGTPSGGTNQATGGTAGQGGQGGDGSPEENEDGGGGGGGGLFGGGGGAGDNSKETKPTTAAAAAAAPRSVPAGVAFETGARPGNGVVTITYDASGASCAAPGAPAAAPVAAAPRFTG